MTKFTKEERYAIAAAYEAIADLCESTKGRDDAPRFNGSRRLERAEWSDAYAAKAVVCKAWLEGVDDPGREASTFYWTRPGYIQAYLLGAGQVTQRKNDSSIGPLIAKARELCPAAVAAFHAWSDRDLAIASTR